MTKRIAGFTLIELLIVVAIISILAAIAVPNFLEAQTRAKVARVKADQRSIATALETYAVDNNNKYPVRHDKWDQETVNILSVPPLREKIYDPDSGQERAAVGLHVLTTPIAYISSLPRDVFNMPVAAMAAPGNPYSDAMEYYDPKQLDAMLVMLRGEGWLTPGAVGRGKGWALISVGPDQLFGLTPNLARFYNYPPESEFTNNTRKEFYDPSNGTISTGNIYRFQGNLEQKVMYPRG